ncbi:UNVERIFIED_CONTAM: guanine nucleotide exchange factor 9, partial [Siphonaria sp. JEL0065]
MKAVALWDYAAVEDNELSFRAGDVVEVLDLCNEDWFEGSLNNKTGYFPANRVRLLKDEHVEQGVSGCLEPPTAISKLIKATAPSLIWNQIWALMELSQQPSDSIVANLKDSVLDQPSEQLPEPRLRQQQQHEQQDQISDSSKRLSTTSRRQAPEPPPSRRSISLESAPTTTATKRSSLVSQTPPAEEPHSNLETLPQTLPQVPELSTESYYIPNSSGAPTPPPVTPSSSPLPIKNPFSDDPSSPPPKKSPVLDSASDDHVDVEHAQHDDEDSELIDSPSRFDNHITIETIALNDVSSDVDRTQQPAGIELNQQQVSDSLTSIVSQNGSKWKPMRDTNGHIYFWNETTNQTSWDPPSVSGDTNTMTASSSQNDILASTPNMSSNHYRTSPPSNSALIDDDGDEAASEGDITGLLVDTPNFAAAAQSTATTPTRLDATISAPVTTATPDLDLTRFDSIPADLIKKEGTIKYKVSTA